MVKTLFIDLDDTLWATSVNNRIALNKLYEFASWSEIFASFDAYYEVYSQINIELWLSYNQGRVTKQELSIERMRRPLLVKGIKLTEERALKFNEKFISFMREQRLLCPNALEVMAYLKNRYEICILSNGFGDIQYRKLSDTGLGKYVDEVVLSSDLGINKPDKRIFDFALQKMKVEKSECIMIGDSWCSDICGASNADIKSIWYNPKSYELPDDSQIQLPIAVIEDLVELKGLL